MKTLLVQGRSVVKMDEFSLILFNKKRIFETASAQK